MNMAQIEEQQEHHWAMCAPLSRVVSDHLSDVFTKTRQQPYVETLQDFYRILEWARQKVFACMTEYFCLNGTMEKEGIATDFFLDALQQASPERSVILPQTLSSWSKAGLVRKGFNKIELHSFAEILAARMIDKRLKGWLPSSRAKQEAHMWVFYQASPSLFVDGEWVDQPIQIIPYPTDMELSPSGILWTPWEGLVWDGWIRVEGFGAIRFVGQMSQYGRLFWQVSMDDLMRWNVPVSFADAGLGTLAQSQEAIQAAAHWTLLALALRKFSEINGKTNEESVSRHENSSTASQR